MSPEHTSQSRLAADLAQLATHDHACLIYGTREEQFDVIVPYLRIGLDRRERCLYVADENTAEAIAAALSAAGVGVDAAIRNGALSILTSREVYLKDGDFDPDRMIRLLEDATAAARAAGFHALRAAGEMTWAIGNVPGADRLIEYEARLERFFPLHDCMALCQYNRRRFPADVLLDVIRTHPIVICADTVCRNFYHVPANEILGAASTDARVERMLAAIRDRQQAEDALYESEERYRVLVESAAELIASVDEQGVILFMNSTGAEWFGLRSHEATGRTVWEVFPEAMANACAEAVRQVIRSGRRVPFVEWTCDPSDDRHYRASVAPLTALTQKPASALIIVRDATELSRAEKEIARYREHLEELVEQRTRDLEQSREQLRVAERLASIGTLAAGVAHEINNPIGMILLAAQNALNAIDGPEAVAAARRALDKIVVDANRCARIVRSMLQFARQEPTEKWLVDLNTLASHAFEVTRPYTVERGVFVRLQLADNLPTVTANPIQIEQVLVNLIRNASEAGPRGSRVCLRTERTPDGVRIAVEDNGRGMTPEQVKHVFDPFYTTRLQHGGNGLGLSIVHGIVTEHGGTIKVQSEPGFGTAVTVDLPCLGAAPRPRLPAVGADRGASQVL